MRVNNIIILLVALMMGGMAAFMARSYIESQARPVASNLGTIVVAAMPLQFGAAITGDNTVEIPWPGGSIPESAFTSKQEVLKDGTRRALAAIERNEPILRSKVTGPGQRASLSSKLEEGKRAVTVRVDDVRGVAGFIMPDDRVDVVLIRPEGGGSIGNNASYSDILLQYVRVLAVDQIINERREQATVAKAVTIEVTPEEAQKVLLATDLGKLSLILRQQGAPGLEASRRVTERDLSQQTQAAPQVRVVAEAPAAPVNATVTVANDRYEVPRMR